MKKIALIIGHSKLRQGARNKKSGLTEYKYNKEFVNKLYQKLLPDILSVKYDSVIFYRKIGMTTLHRRLNKYNPDLAIEFHCNSVKDKNISGSEILIKRDSFYCKVHCNLFDLSQRVSDCLVIKNRGLKFRKINQRGGKFLHNVKSDLNFIAEPFFISNDSDLEKALNNQNELIDIFVEFIKDFVE